MSEFITQRTLGNVLYQFNFDVGRGFLLVINMGWLYEIFMCSLNV